MARRFYLSVAAICKLVRLRLIRHSHTSIRRQQYGASVGGPLVKDKTFWFASGEYRHQNSAVLRASGSTEPSQRTIAF